MGDAGHEELKPYSRCWGSSRKSGVLRSGGWVWALSQARQSYVDVGKLFRVCEIGTGFLIRRAGLITAGWEDSVETGEPAC